MTFQKLKGVQIRVNKKNIFPLVIVFLLGAFTMFLLIKPEERNEIYETTSLYKAVNKVYDATLLIEAYNGNALKNTSVELKAIILVI